MTGEEQLGGKLLEGVSRSFYLTLKALPQGLREPISLAYLLARAADTLADTPNITESIKQECLTEFDRLVQAEVRDETGERVLCERLLREFVPLQEDAGEARLLERLPEAFDAYRKSPPLLMEATRGVLDPIVKGQLMDIQRFPVDGQLRSLTTEDELDEYTYLVAGCVGGFWTKLCASELEGAIDPKVSLDDMLVWGIRYGKGLQLVNILRDIAKDVRMGRCYFPAEELAAHGLTLDMVQADPAKLVPVTASWRAHCREHLECGLQYLDALQHKRLRFATALPLLLGIRTLALVDQADATALVQGVKVSRGEVAKILFETGIANLRQGGLRRMAEALLRK
jgi:farnesyl-diphosphate farnesyltransferase